MIAQVGQRFQMGVEEFEELVRQSLVQEKVGALVSRGRHCFSLTRLPPISAAKMKKLKLITPSSIRTRLNPSGASYRRGFKRLLR